MTESESALVASLSLIGRLPGSEVHADPTVTWVAGGRPLEGLNHVLRLDLTGDDAAIEAAIDDIDVALRERGAAPATWWTGPSTSPLDLARRLGARGFADAEPEYGMVMDVADAGTPTHEVEPVTDDAGLDVFLGVMAEAYGWRDGGSWEAWAALYRTSGASGPGEPPWSHVIVRRDGQPAACASLFTSEGHAFVSNVGTIPSARGAGLGTSATLGVLDIARRSGFERASLTASVMGRSVYARIGFREEAHLGRCISPGRAGQADPG